MCFWAVEGHCIKLGRSHRGCILREKFGYTPAPTAAGGWGWERAGRKKRKIEVWTINASVTIRISEKTPVPEPRFSVMTRSSHSRVLGIWGRTTPTVSPSNVADGSARTATSMKWKPDAKAHAVSNSLAQTSGYYGLAHGANVKTGTVPLDTH